MRAGGTAAAPSSSAPKANSDSVAITTPDSIPLPGDVWSLTDAGGVLAMRMASVKAAAFSSLAFAVARRMRAPRARDDCVAVFGSRRTTVAAGGGEGAGVTAAGEMGGAGGGDAGAGGGGVGGGGGGAGGGGGGGFGRVSGRGGGGFGSGLGCVVLVVEVAPPAPGAAANVSARIASNGSAANARLIRAGRPGAQPEAQMGGEVAAPSSSAGTIKCSPSAGVGKALETMRATSPGR